MLLSGVESCLHSFSQCQSRRPVVNSLLLPCVCSGVGSAHDAAHIGRNRGSPVCRWFYTGGWRRFSRNFFGWQRSRARMKLSGACFVTFDVTVTLPVHAPVIVNVNLSSLLHPRLLLHLFLVFSIIVNDFLFLTWALACGLYFVDSDPSIFVSFSFSTRVRYSVYCLELKNMFLNLPNGVASLLVVTFEPGEAISPWAGSPW